MKNHLDLTIDFETCSLSADAAVMQVAAVPWIRDADEDPFMGWRLCAEEPCDIGTFVGNVDLRSCVVDGLDFDPGTIKWWSERSEEAKHAVTRGLAEPISDVLYALIDYMGSLVKKFSASSLCLWCQGMDVDIAILRSLCRRYGVCLEKTVPHTSFRDCRTVILEAALLMGGKDEEDILSHPGRAYELLGEMPDEFIMGSGAHDALYDAVRSSFYTWRALRYFNSFRKGDEKP